MITANVFDIKRFGINDGAGIRTVLFLKGCPLRCRWCQNPEGLTKDIGLWCVRGACVRCASCVRACSLGAVTMGGEGVALDRARCTLCGQCVSACPTGAMRMDAAAMGVEEAMAEIENDRVFYGQDGGVTLSGGECTASPAFSLAVLRLCREKGIHTAIETALYAPPAVMAAFIEAADSIIADIKLLDPERHAAATGVDNSLILENFKTLAQSGKDVLVRIPLIPGYTADADNIRSIAAFVAGVNRNIPLELVNFNPLCEGKYETLGQAYIPTEKKPYGRAEMEKFLAAARESGLTVRYTGMKG